GLSGDAQALNLIFLLTDDQDVVLGGLTPQTKINRLLTQQGALFVNAFVHTPVCCPSRSSFLSGRHIRNGGAINNSVSGNCAGPEWVNVVQHRTFATHLHDAGYYTSYAGKYLNDYALPGSPNCTHETPEACAAIPPGWDRWLGLFGNSKYYNYTVSDDGVPVDHGDDYTNDYFPDLVANRTIGFIYEAARVAPDRPILAVNAWPTPHGPHPPAPWAAGRYAGYQAPRTPSYNASSEYMATKNYFMRQLDMIWPEDAQSIDVNYQQRWETLLSVDNHVESIVQALADTGRLNNTFIIYASDHGFQLGQHRLLGDKRHQYENDIRIPFIVRGPGVPPNSTETRTVLNIDIAPTLTELGTGAVPDDMDGRSFASFFSESPPSSWRQDFMIEYHGEAGPCGYYTCPPAAHPHMHEIDGVNNTYTCVRTLNETENSLYCEFVDAEQYKEYYNIALDYWQLNNTFASLPDSKREALATRLQQFRECTGATCR
ncbi:uncharacterized protein MONBRDRAFT_849, partial [Monosiga brevicollis MX1]